MKPLYLTIEGLNSFREKQEIDFAVLGGENIFCICGPTGSGKTTVLDAMILSLFGRSGRASVGELVNLSCTLAQTEFTFSLGGDVYCARRTVYKNKNRSSKATLIKNGAVEADGTEAVNEKIVGLLGMDGKDFTKTVILEQGKFAQFLNDGKSDRIVTVAKMFGLERFRDLISVFNKRFSEANNAMKVNAARLEQYAPYSTAALELAEREAAELKAAAAKLKEDERTARERLTLAVEAQKRAEQREKLKARRAECEKQLSEAQAELKGAVPPEDAQERVQSAQSEIAAAREAIARLEVYRESAAELRQREESRQKLLADFGRKKTELEALVKGISAAESMLPALHGAARAAREAREAFERTSMAEALRSNLKAGDACPVCGGEYKECRINPAADGGDIKRLKEREAEAEKALSAADLRLASDRAALHSAEQVLQEITLRGQAVKGEIDKRRAEIAAAVGGEDIEASVALRQRTLQTATRLKEALEAEIKRVRERETALKVKTAALSAELKGICQTLEEGGIFTLSNAETEQLRGALARCERQRAEAEKALALKEKFALDCRAALPEKGRLEQECKALKGAIDGYKLLSDMFKGGRFSEYVCSKYIEDFCRTAAAKLLELSGGKYSIEYEKGEGLFTVTDYMRGGQKRGVGTLSGGESFLASVSVAIAISLHLSGFKSFGFFFLDEGFGTLDENAIEVVSDMLHVLSRDTMVGVVTHRAELTERIAKKLHVTPADDERGTSLSIEDN